jgi:zinc/manganese transport system ATP-binding protein
MSPVRDETALRIRGAALSFGARRLWDQLDLDIERGELVAVLGPNGSGKTSLLRAILGLQSLDSGTIEVDGRPARQARDAIGYVPQQKSIGVDTPLRARDLVAFGVSGTRFGLPIPSRRDRRRVDELLERVGATAYAKVPVGLLSGGEFQRLRVAQALAGGPRLLLFDEPLLSLDLHHQRGVADLLERERSARSSGIIVVTHDVNPFLGSVDRVLYLAEGRFRVGTPEEVLTSEVLTELYGTPVEVLRSRGRLVVVGAPDAGDVHHDHAVGEPPFGGR